MSWPFTFWIICSRGSKIFANSRPSASNFKSFLNHWNNFLTEGQNNFENKIPIITILSAQILTLVELSVWADKKSDHMPIFIHWHFKWDIYWTLNHTLIVLIHSNVSYVIEFLTWWVLKSKVFAQKSTIVKWNCSILWIDIAPGPQKGPKLYFQSHFSMSKNNGIKQKIKSINLGDHLLWKTWLQFIFRTHQARNSMT